MEKSIPQTTNVIDMMTAEQAIVKNFRTALANDEEIDFMGFVHTVGISDDQVELRKFCIEKKICTAKEWKRGVMQSKVRDLLGAFPRNVDHLVELYAASEKLVVTYKKQIRSDKPISRFGGEFDEAAIKDNKVKSFVGMLKNFNMTQKTVEEDILGFIREYELGYHNRDVAEAVNLWFRKKSNNRLEELMHPFIYFGAGDKTAVANTWAAVAKKFDMQEHDAEYVECILKKFIWQVKRKVYGLPVTNHLMPVLLGGQGLGKSTFVRWLLAPIEELVGNTDFAAIEDNRTAGLWDNYVLFLDEMSHAAKADVEKVKNKITAEVVEYRPMGTNYTTQIKQRATLIGCSNKELDQLIRDETGNRRFAGLRFASPADHSVLDDFTSEALWMTVDEHGPDPSSPIMERLLEKQAENREKSSVELWLEVVKVRSDQIGQKLPASDLYHMFRDFCEHTGVHYVPDQPNWGKEFNRLIAGDYSGVWAKQRTAKSSAYVKLEK